MKTLSITELASRSWLVLTGFRSLLTTGSVFKFIVYQNILVCHFGLTGVQYNKRRKIFVKCQIQLRKSFRKQITETSFYRPPNTYPDFNG